MHFRAPSIILALALLTAPAYGQFATNDNFNRPNSTNLGPRWFEVNGDFVIQGNQAKGNTAFANDTWMHNTVFAQPYAQSKARIEFSSSAGDQFFAAGLVIGADPATWGGVAVLVQDNDLDGFFDRIFFNAAVNAGAWFSSPTPIFYDFPAPIAAGQLTVWIQDGGDVAVARVEDALGNLVGVYGASGIVGTPFAPTGTRAGVWVRSRPFVDDFWAIQRQVLDAYPQQVSVSAGGEQTIDLTFESARAGDRYLVLAALQTASPGIPIGGGFLLPIAMDPVFQYFLQFPNVAPYTDTFGTLDAFGHARARFDLPPGVIPFLAGFTFHYAAITWTPGIAPFTITGVSNTATLELIP